LRLRGAIAVPEVVAGGINEPGVDDGVFSINDFGVRWWNDVFADRFDEAATNDDRGRFEFGAWLEDDAGILDGDAVDLETGCAAAWVGGFGRRGAGDESENHGEDRQRLPQSR
jgi:hypothetical protein